MPRSISASFRRSVESRFQDDADLCFMTITHSLLVDPIRIVSDTKDYTYGGYNWTGLPFDIVILSDNESAPEAQFQVPNVDLAIGQAILAMAGEPARLTIMLMHSDDFDLTVNPRTAVGTPSVEYSASSLFLTNVKMDAIIVTGTIVGWSFTQKTWPSIRATQNLLPGLFR